MSWNANIVWVKAAGNENNYFEPADELKEYVEEMKEKIIEFYETYFATKNYDEDFDIDIEMNPGGEKEKYLDGVYNGEKITIFYNRTCDYFFDAKPDDFSVCLEQENYSGICTKKDVLKAKVAATLAHEMMHWFHFCDSHKKRRILDDHVDEDGYSVVEEYEEDDYDDKEYENDAVAIKETFAVYFVQCFIKYCLAKDNSGLGDFLIDIFDRPERSLEENIRAGKVYNEKLGNSGDYICGEYLRIAGGDKIGNDCDIYNDIYNDYVNKNYKEGAKKARELKKTDGKQC